MKFQVSVSDLVEKLGVVERGLPTRSVIPAVNGILVKAEDGRITLTANNLDYSIKGEIEGAEIEVEGELVFPKKLVDVARKLPGDTVSFDYSEDAVMRVQSGGAKFTLATIDPGEFPADTPLEEWSFWSEVSFSGAEFREAMNMLIFATTKDETKPVFTGVLFTLTPGKLLCFASDTHRVARLEMAFEQELEEEVRLLVPGKTLNSVVKIAGVEDKVTCFFSSQEVVFTVGDYVVMGNLLEDRFPSIGSVFPKESEADLKIDRTTFEELIDRATVVSTRELPRVTLSVSGDKLSVSAKEDVGSLEESIHVEKTGEDMAAIMFNAKYLNEPLRYMPVETFNAGLNGGRGPLLFDCESDAWNYKYLVLPIIDNPA